MSTWSARWRLIWTDERGEFNVTNPVSVGDATKKDHYDRVFNNTKAVKAIAAIDVGGSASYQQTDATFAPIHGALHAELDGTEADGIQVQCMAQVDAGTGQIRLFNVTDAVAVGSAVTVTATTATLTKITGLTPAAGVKAYRVEAQKGTTWITVYGAHLRLT